MDLMFRFAVLPIFAFAFLNLIAMAVWMFRQDRDPFSRYLSVCMALIAAAGAAFVISGIVMFDK